MCRIILLISTILLCIGSQNSFSAAYCNDEKITSLTVSGDKVYFATDKSCSSWCQLDTNWSTEAINRAYSMMLAAKTTGKGLRFNWAEHNSPCENQLPAYASPRIFH